MNMTAVPYRLKSSVYSVGSVNRVMPKSQTSRSSKPL